MNLDSIFLIRSEKAVDGYYWFLLDDATVPIMHTSFIRARKFDSELAAADMIKQIKDKPQISNFSLIVKEY